MPFGPFYRFAEQLGIPSVSHDASSGQRADVNLPCGTAGSGRIEPLCRVSTRCVLYFFIAASVARKACAVRENLSRKQRLTRA